MITLNASGGSITFTFDGNSTYLNDGTITCPVNSLALIIDESDMVTFKKSQSSDIFVSANIAEFGMTKAELESWFKANAVGSTGGGGGGVTPSEVQTMIDESISGKQDTLIAGRGISITTGETADTVSISLPISAGTGSNSIIEGDAANNASGRYSHAEGYQTTASDRNSHAEGWATLANGNAAHAEGHSTSATSYAHAEGRYTSANGIYSHAEGYYTQTHNQSEHASGQYNVSSNPSFSFGNSGNTLFSVGNGTADNARHNAFEIRQNGDIYFTKDGQDVKLQDNLGGLTSGEVQTMIDESISGKIDASISSTSTNAVQNQALFDELRIPSGEAEVETTLEWVESGWPKTTTNYPSGCTEFKLNCEGISGDIFIDFNGNNGLIGYIRINDLEIAQSSFEEGVLDYTVSGNVMTISYPTVTNVVSLSSASNLENKATVSTIETVYIPLIDQVSANTTALSGKQDTLSAGTGIDITNDVISVTGKVNTNTYTAYTATTNSRLAEDEEMILRNQTALDGKVDTNTYDTYTAATDSRLAEDEEVTAAALVNLAEADEVAARALIDLNDKFGGLKLVKLTQSAYDALVSGGTIDNSTLYVIVN